jgi:hypothetical protein
MARPPLSTHAFPVHDGPVGTRRALWLAWSLCGVSFALALVGATLNVVGHPTASDLNYDTAFAVTFLGFSVTGSLIAARLPGNPVGWLLLIQGMCWELSGALAGYANYVLFARPGFLAGGTVAAWALNWLYLPAIGAAVLLFLLFPDGRASSGRWRPAGWLLGVAAVISLGAVMFAPGPMPNAEPVSNPFGIGGLHDVFRAALTAGNLLFALAASASVLSLVFRFRRAGGAERHQLKWLALAACLVGLAFTAYNVLGAFGLSGLADYIGPHHSWRLRSPLAWRSSGITCTTSTSLSAGPWCSVAWRPSSPWSMSPWSSGSVPRSAGGQARTWLWP